MTTQPYSIYTEARPFRIAFLVSKADWHEWFDLIIAFNRKKWGGRYNPIVVTDGVTIEEPMWSFLRSYDPDIIYSTVQLSDELQQKIQTFLSPLKIAQPQGRGFIRVDDDPLSILPTAKNVSRISRDAFGDISSVVLFESDESTPVIIRQFIERNFGALQHGRMAPYPNNQALSECKTKVYRITDLASLNTALDDLGDFRNRVVFFAQFCSIADFHKDIDYDRAYEHFTVVVGEECDDLTYFWNKTLGTAAWMRPGFTCLWLPKELAQDATIRPGLTKFLNRYVGSTGNNNQHQADFVSFSIEEAVLQSIVTDIGQGLHYPRKPVHHGSPVTPEFRLLPFFHLKQHLELHRAHSTEEYLVLPEPGIEDGISDGGQYWFADVYIQYRPELFQNIIGKDYWWQLPKRSHLLRNLMMFNRPSRINEDGMFSVLMKRKSDFARDDGPLIVKIPDDWRVFQSLFCGEKFDCIDADRRAQFLSRPFHTARISDKGGYFNGVVSLFSGLQEAAGLLEERYWRRVFERMSSQDQQKDKKKVEFIFETLKKTVARGRNLSSDDGLRWLAEKVFAFAKNVTKQSVDLTFSDLIEMAREETDEYKNQHGGEIDFDEDGLKDELSNLIERNVLLVGVKPKCQRCGYRFWCHISEASQKITCKGCGFPFGISSEEEWHYQLNSLVRSAFADQGTVPVLLALGQLLFDARTSFLYIPSTELFKAGATTNEMSLDSEVDLACIVDGKFVIGEIKQSISLFNEKDFSRMKEMALALRPDGIIFSSMDKQPNAFMISEIAKLKSDLALLEIDVEWYQLRSWIFDAGPVR